MKDCLCLDILGRYIVWTYTFLTKNTMFVIILYFQEEECIQLMCLFYSFKCPFVELWLVTNYDFCMLPVQLMCNLINNILFNGLNAKMDYFQSNLCIKEGRQKAKVPINSYIHIISRALTSQFPFRSQLQNEEDHHPIKINVLHLTFAPN